MISGGASGSQRLAFVVGFILLGALIVIVASDTRLGLIAAAGFFVALLVFWVLARAGIALLGAIRGGAGPGWRQGLASLRRHGTANALQVAALAVGLMAMLLLTVIRGELLGAWQQALPADAPNRFIINIQPEQRAGVGELLTAAGIDAELLPMIRARLTHIDDRPVSAADYPDDERAQRLVEREFNLSWHADLPAGNVVAAGRWFQPSEAGQGLASVEAGLAATLRIAVGDTLTFNVAGLEKQVRVSNLRRLSWDSMRVNFFVMTPPGVIEDAPAQLHHQLLSATHSGNAAGAPAGALSQPDPDRSGRHPGAVPERAGASGSGRFSSFLCLRCLPAASYSMRRCCRPSMPAATNSRSCAPWAPAAGNCSRRCCSNSGWSAALPG